MKKSMEKKVEIAIVLDRSGSMTSIKNETIEGYNSFISNQVKNKVKARVTLAQFDDEYELLYQSVKIEHISYLNDKTYVPRGLTALLDAIGSTISLIEENHNKLDKDKRPDKVLFVIITDGLENASREYNRSEIFKKIRKMEKDHGWEFIYLGANQDAISTSSQFGIKAERSMTFAADGEGTTDAFNAISRGIQMSAKLHQSFSFTDEQREKQKR